VIWKFSTEKMAKNGPDSLSGPDSTSETTPPHHELLSYSGSVVLSSELVGTDVMVLSVMKPQPGASVLKLEIWMTKPMWWFW